eukprot:8717084-Pyramimonas_sp.AAC.1
MLAGGSESGTAVSGSGSPGTHPPGCQPRRKRTRQPYLGERANPPSGRAQTLIDASDRSRKGSDDARRRTLRLGGAGGPDLVLELAPGSASVAD